MSLKTIGALLCGAVAFGAIQVAATPAKADKLDLILQRLDHVIDLAGTTCLLCGLALSGLMAPVFAGREMWSRLRWASA